MDYQQHQPHIHKKYLAARKILKEFQEHQKLKVREERIRRRTKADIPRDNGEEEKISKR